MSRTRFAGITALVGSVLLLSGLALATPGQPVDPGVPENPTQPLVRFGDVDTAHIVLHLVIKAPDRLSFGLPELPPNLRPVSPSSSRSASVSANSLVGVGSGSVSPALGFGSGASFSPSGGAGAREVPTDPEAALRELRGLARSLGLR